MRRPPEGAGIEISTPRARSNSQTTGNDLEETGYVLPLLEDAVCQLVERLQLMDPVNCPLVDLDLFDRNPGLSGEQRHDLFVGFREFTMLLLGQVEIPVHNSTHENRNAEEASHRRMPGRKAEEVWLLRYIGNTDRTRFSKEDAENPVVAREIADASSCPVVDPCRDEALEV